MKPLKIYFKILQSGNGKFLKTKNEVNNLIVDLINKNPSKPASVLREIAIEEFKNGTEAKRVLTESSSFFIDSVTDIEILITFLPQEQVLHEQFYIQWRYVQNSAPYRLIQYLDDNKVVVYSEKTKVIHTVKLDKGISIIADDELPNNYLG
ncbi:hypothetical protein [Pedobacter metabolipauper]|uniref:Uncharacterized protein n=1 Tax=Pedobacter metabolipauper TaxID=425513 RepID=A0A4R6ST14_9SPHI|nr:hypothetical protein [Pedobacter metabolipauper]TDQ07545.1 hypothetical protein ATK78_3672 [Pedobacter metabolipauper]